MPPKKYNRMPFKALVFTILYLSLLVTSGQADIVSPDNTFIANDVFSTDFHTRLNRNITQLTNGVNNVHSNQIIDDTLDEATMADEINPRVRTSEGAACEKVYIGLLPSTAASLTSDISAGTAYPLGYRCNKASATSKTYTAFRWTYVDIDQNCDFQYAVVTVDAVTPAVTANSIRLARVSTDGTTVADVTDLRTTSCASGPLSLLKDTATEASIGDMFTYGRHVRQNSPIGENSDGWIAGLMVSYDTATTFKVTKGSAYINGEYRFVSNDVTVTTGNDNPAVGESGLDSGSITAKTQYYAFAVADEPNASSLSITYSTSPAAPSGLTNYRLLGAISTNASSQFTSRDQTTVHAVNDKEVAGGWIIVNLEGTVISLDHFNVSSITDGGAGISVVTWANDFAKSPYAIACSGEADDDSGNTEISVTANDITQSSFSMEAYEGGGSAVDTGYVSCVAFGDN